MRPGGEPQLRLNHVVRLAYTFPARGVLPTTASRTRPNPTLPGLGVKRGLAGRQEGLDGRPQAGNPRSVYGINVLRLGTRA